MSIQLEMSESQFEKLIACAVVVLVHVMQGVPQKQRAEFIEMVNEHLLTAMEAQP